MTLQSIAEFSAYFLFFFFLLYRKFWKVWENMQAIGYWRKKEEKRLERAIQHGRKEEPLTLNSNLDSSCGSRNVSQT